MESLSVMALAPGDLSYLIGVPPGSQGKGLRGINPKVGAVISEPPTPLIHGYRPGIAGFCRGFWQGVAGFGSHAGIGLPAGSGIVDGFSGGNRPHIPHLLAFPGW